jgi:squalene-associated FAD-dependent desaturase
MTPETRHVAVIGGGWAGCAAAVELAHRGLCVSLFESARVLGGRARRVDIDNLGLDNGQHILIGAYTETLRVMRLVGVDLDSALLNLPLQMRYPEDSGGMDFVAPRLPAPLHMLVALLRAKGLNKDDKLSLARFSTAARWMDWQLNDDCSVAELLTRFDQTERLTKLMWRPLCIAALNTPPERASANVFLNVLRDSLGARRRASDMLLPRTDLTTLFPQRAATFIGQRGGEVFTGKAIKRIARNDMRWHLETGNDSNSLVFDAVVVATQASHAATLLDGLIDTSNLMSFDYEPITTCYLQYAPTVGLSMPFAAMVDEPARQEWGQFVFDRGTLNNKHAGIFAIVVSASSDAIELGHDALAAAIAKQLADVFARPELGQPIWSKVISEKRATFSCTPGLMRPPNATGIDGLLLAGDYTAGEYPATLEAAVRSGVEAARCIV